jgi:dihydrolipoamide dehydrogenase
MTYDVIVLGSGPAGFYFAKTAASYGKKVLMIEKDLLGGTGFRTGCLPAKKYLDGLREARRIEEASSKDWCQAQVDKNILYQTLNREIEAIEPFMMKQLKALGVEVLYGTPRVESSTKVTIGNKTYTADHVVLATGTTTIPLLGACVDEKVILTHKGMTALKNLPESLIIIGGNVEGIEFASYLSGYGVAVTIIALADVLLEGTDRDLCQSTLAYIEENGGKVLLNTKVSAIERRGDQAYVTLSAGQELKADKVLLTGLRSGNIPEGLETSIEIENTCAKVNDFYQTSLEGLYAIGDVNGLHGMAHIALQQGIQLADYLYSGKTPVRDYDSLPRSIFTIGEIAGAGLQEETCLQEGIQHTVKKATFDQTFRGWSKGLTYGSIKVIFDEEEKIIGAWMTGASASDYIGMIGLWIDKKLSMDDIKASLFIHPSLGEGLLDAILNK